MWFFFSFLDIVAEVTQPSLGVGYEIGRAVAMDKKILCLYRPQDGKRKCQSKSEGLDHSLSMVFFFFWKLKKKLRPDLNMSILI